MQRRWKPQCLPTRKTISIVVLLSILVSLLAIPGCTTYKVDRNTVSSNQLVVNDKPSMDETAPATSIEQPSHGGANTTLSTETRERIESDLQNLAESSEMSVGVAFIDLTTGEIIDYQGSASFTSASMIKLLIAYAFLEQVENGSYTLDDYYTLQASDIVGGTGTLSSLGAGARITYREILTKMISVSDNTGANILINAVGMDSVNAAASKLELSATTLNRYMMDSNAMSNGIENYTSALDTALLFERIYNGSFVNPEASSLMLQALEAQEDIGGILNGLPPGVTFAHKTGTLNTVRHDGGIVEGDQPFVLVVLCGGSGFYEQGALSTMSRIASCVYTDATNG